MKYLVYFDVKLMTWDVAQVVVEANDEAEAETKARAAILGSDPIVVFNPDNVDRDPNGTDVVVTQCDISSIETIK